MALNRNREGLDPLGEMRRFFSQTELHKICDSEESAFS